jgi:hypothetical protein
MISRSWRRADNRFLRSASSPQERVAALAKLRSRRTMLASCGLLLLLTFSLSFLVDHFWHRHSIDSTFPVLFCLVMILLQDVNNQIRLLEVLQRHQLQTPSPDAPTI